MTRVGTFPLWLCGILSIAALAGLLAPIVGVPAFAIPASTILIVAIGRRKSPLHISIIAFVVLVLAPLPAALPSGFRLGQGQVVWADIAAVACTIISLLSGHKGRTDVGIRALGVWTVICGLATLAGLLNGASFQYVVRDLRPVFYLLAITVALITVCERGESIMGLLTRTGFGILLYSAIVTILSQATSTRLFAGRFDTAALYIGDDAIGGQGTSRVLLSSTYLVVAVLPILVAGRLTLVHPVWPGRTAVYTAAAASVVCILFSYQRTQFLAPVITSAVLILISGSIFLALGRLARSITAAIVFAGLPVVLLLRSWSSSASPIIETWLLRVIGGLNPSIVGMESSNYWRQLESALALRSIQGNSVFGVGFGAPFRTNYTVEPFAGSDGLAYVHNNFLALYVKLGVLAPSILILLFVLFCIRVGRVAMSCPVDGARQNARFAIAVLGSLIVISPVAPITFSNGGALVFGIGLAIGTQALRQLASSTDEGTCAVAHDSSGLARTS